MLMTVVFGRLLRKRSTLRNAKLGRLMLIVAETIEIFFGQKTL